MASVVLVIVMCLLDFWLKLDACWFTLAWHAVNLGREHL